MRWGITLARPFVDKVIIVILPCITKVSHIAISVNNSVAVAT